MVSKGKEMGIYDSSHGIYKSSTGGSNTEQLNDLIDVNLNNAPLSGSLLQYQDGLWVDSNITINSKDELVGPRGPGFTNATFNQSNGKITLVGQTAPTATSDVVLNQDIRGFGWTRAALVNNNDGTTNIKLLTGDGVNSASTDYTIPGNVKGRIGPGFTSARILTQSRSAGPIVPGSTFYHDAGNAGDLFLYYNDGSGIKGPYNSRFRRVGPVVGSGSTTGQVSGGSDGAGFTNARLVTNNSEARIAGYFSDGLYYEQCVIGDLQLFYDDQSNVDGEFNRRWITVGAVKGDQGIKGDQGVSVENLSVNQAGDLIVTLTNRTINAGSVRGDGSAALVLQETCFSRDLDQSGNNRFFWRDLPIPYLFRFDSHRWTYHDKVLYELFEYGNSVPLTFYQREASAKNAISRTQIFGGTKGYHILQGKFRINMPINRTYVVYRDNSSDFRFYSSVHNDTRSGYRSVTVNGTKNGVPMPIARVTVGGRTDIWYANDNQGIYVAASSDHNAGSDYHDRGTVNLHRIQLLEDVDKGLYWPEKDMFFIFGRNAKPSASNTGNQLPTRMMVSRGGFQWAAVYPFGSDTHFEVGAAGEDRVVFAGRYGRTAMTKDGVTWHCSDNSALWTDTYPTNVFDTRRPNENRAYDPEGRQLNNTWNPNLTSSAYRQMVCKDGVFLLNAWSTESGDVRNPASYYYLDSTTEGDGPIKIFTNRYQLFISTDGVNWSGVHVAPDIERDRLGPFSCLFADDTFFYFTIKPKSREDELANAYFSKDGIIWRRMKSPWKVTDSGRQLVYPPTEVIWDGSRLLGWYEENSANSDWAFRPNVGTPSAHQGPGLINDWKSIGPNPRDNKNIWSANKNPSNNWDNVAIFDDNPKHVYHVSTCSKPVISNEDAPIFATMKDKILIIYEDDFVVDEVAFHLPLKTEIITTSLTRVNGVAYNGYVYLVFGVGSPSCVFATSDFKTFEKVITHSTRADAIEWCGNIFILAGHDGSKVIFESSVDGSSWTKLNVESRVHSSENNNNNDSSIGGGLPPIGGDFFEFWSYTCGMCWNGSKLLISGDRSVVISDAQQYNTDTAQRSGSNNFFLSHVNEPYGDLQSGHSYRDFPSRNPKGRIITGGGDMFYLPGGTEKSVYAIQSNPPRIFPPNFSNSTDDHNCVGIAAMANGMYGLWNAGTSYEIRYGPASGNHKFLNTTWDVFARIENPDFDGTFEFKAGNVTQYGEESRTNCGFFTAFSPYSALLCVPSRDTKLPYLNAFRARYYVFKINGKGEHRLVEVLKNASTGAFGSAEQPVDLNEVETDLASIVPDRAFCFGRMQCGMQHPSFVTRELRYNDWNVDRREDHVLYKGIDATKPIFKSSEFLPVYTTLPSSILGNVARAAPPAVAETPTLDPPETEPDISDLIIPDSELPNPDDVFEPPIVIDPDPNIPNFNNETVVSHATVLLSTDGGINWIPLLPDFYGLTVQQIAETISEYDPLLQVAVLSDQQELQYTNLGPFPFLLTSAMTTPDYYGIYTPHTATIDLSNGLIDVFQIYNGGISIAPMNPGGVLVTQIGDLTPDMPFDPSSAGALVAVSWDNAVTWNIVFGPLVNGMLVGDFMNIFATNTIPSPHNGHHYEILFENGYLKIRNTCDALPLLVMTGDVSPLGEFQPNPDLKLAAGGSIDILSSHTGGMTILPLQTFP
jgi:hypothetical protein